MSAPSNVFDTSLTFFERAEQMALYGVPIVPLPPAKKFPPPKDFPKLATTDMETIKGWLQPNENGHGPALAQENSNCACVAKPGFVWFLDIDNLSAVDAEIKKKTGHSLGEIQTLIVQSSPNKRHFYFKQNADSEALGNFSYDDESGELCSVRQNNLYVVSPFSVHPETHKEYTITRDHPVAEAPEWLVGWLKSIKTASLQREKEIQTNPEAKVPKGSRDKFLFAEACKLRDTRISEKAAVAALEVINQDRCEPPMPKAVVKMKVESAYKRESRIEVPDTEAVEKILATPDMAESVLVGRLGEIYDKHMRTQFPISWAWVALLVVGNLLAARPAADMRTNLYGALVGEVHSGKSQCIEWVIRLLDVKSPELLKVMAGSAEGLLKKLSQCGSEQKRLLFPDELGHLLEKAKIDNASFPYILNRAYYDSNFDSIVARGKEFPFKCNLSLLGGVVTEQFDQLFGAQSTGGLYDRFMFGEKPSEFQYDYVPFNGIAQKLEAERVEIARDVWEVKKEWVRSGMNSRVVEHGLRAAVICASLDGHTVLRGKDLEPTLAFVKYQESTRRMLQPNPGENPEARLAVKILAYLNRHAPNGEWMNQRDLFRHTRGYDLGPTACVRAVESLERAGEVHARAKREVGGGRQIRLAV